MKNGKMLVSICMPTYNGETFLEEALKSICDQTYKKIEVIVSDDQSNDNTVKIIEEFRIKVDFPVTIFKHQPKGIGANWNNCIKNANGEFIKFLFQDDVLFPTCIQEMVEVIKKDKNIGLVASKRKFLIEGKLNATLIDWIAEYKDLQINLDLPELDINFLDKNLFRDKGFLEVPQNIIGEPTAVLFRKSVLKKISGFREDLQQILDAEFYYRLLKYYKIAIINKDLVAFRIHPLQTTNVNRNKPIKDYNDYDRTLYVNFFWYLSLVQQKRLFFKFNIIGKIFRRLEYAIKNRE